MQRLIARVNEPTIRAVDTLGNCSLMLTLKRPGSQPEEALENLWLARARNSDLTRNDIVLHRQGHLELAREAIERGAEIEERDAEWNTALFVAVMTRRLAGWPAGWSTGWPSGPRSPRRRSTWWTSTSVHEAGRGRPGASSAIRSSSWNLTPDCANDSLLYLKKTDRGALAEVRMAESNTWRSQLLREADTRGVPGIVLVLRRSMQLLTLQMM